MGNDARHLLLLHQQGLCQLSVDVIKDKPLPPEVVNPGAQHLIVTLADGCLTCFITQCVCATQSVSSPIPGCRCVACDCNVYATAVKLLPDCVTWTRCTCGTSSPVGSPVCGSASESAITARS